MCYALSHKSKAFLWSLTLHSFCFYLFVLNLLGFLFTFQPHSFWPKLQFWGGEGRERRKGIQSLHSHSSFPLQLFYMFKVWSPPIDNLWNKVPLLHLRERGKRRWRKWGSMPSSPFPTHWPQVSTCNCICSN